MSRSLCGAVAFRGGPALAVLALLLAPILATSACAQPAGADLVEARLALAMESPSSGRFDGNFSIFSLTMNGTPAVADTLRLMLAGPDGPGVRAAIESAARSMFLDRFRGMFPNDSLASVSCLLDNSSLEDFPGTDGLHPPVVVRADGALAVGPSSFGLPPAADLGALAPLVLADGALLFREVPLDAPPGQAVSLSLESFPGSLFDETGGRTLLLELDNTGGQAPASRTFGATLRAGSPLPSGPDSLRVSGIVDIPDLSTVRIDGSVEFCRADPTGYWAPPAGLRNLSSVSGATLSELVRSGVLTEQHIYEYGVLPVQAALQENLADAFNLTLRFTPNWSTEGNLTCTVGASSNGRPLFGPSTPLLLGALRAGAKYSFSIPVDVGWPVEMEFIMPEGLGLGGLSAAGESAGRPLFRWADDDGKGAISAVLSSDRAFRPAGDDVSISVVADFSEPLADMGKLLLEGSADVPVAVDVRVRIGVVAVPAEISAYLPDNLSLPFISADLLRLMLSERAIAPSDLDALLREVQPRLSAAVRAALGRSVTPEVRFVPETLEGYDLNRMDGSRPIEITARATGQRTKHVDLFKSVAASSGLAAITQDFSFSGVAGWNVSYLVRFSPETRLVSVRSSGVKAARGSDGGRDHFKVLFGPAGGSSNVTAELEPSAGLLLRSLGPVCVPALIMLAVAAAFVFRRFRRRRKAKAVEWDP